MNEIQDYTPDASIIKEFKAALKKNDSNMKEFCGNNKIKYGSFRVALSKNSKMSKKFADAIYEYIGKSNNEDTVQKEEPKERDVEQELMDAIRSQYPEVYNSMLDDDKVTLIISSGNAAESVKVLTELEERAYDYISDIVALTGLEGYFVVATAHKEDSEKLANAFNEICKGA